MAKYRLLVGDCREMLRTLPVVTLTIADDVTWRVNVVDAIWRYLDNEIKSADLKILR